LGIILGLTAALCWGIADFLARFATRHTGTYRTLFFMQIIGFVALSIYMEATGGWSRWGAVPGWQPWAWGVLAGLLNTASSLALYRSFETGILAVVSPIGASYPALTVILALASGEALRPARAAGVAAVLVGVVLAAISFERAAEVPEAPHHHHHPRGHLLRGVGWAIAAACGYGVLFWLLGFRVTPVLGGFASVWVIRITTCAALALVAAPVRQSLGPPRGSVWWLIAGIGLIDTAAFVANNVALHTEQVAVASVLASLYGAVTVVLAWIFLRERLQWTQWLGIALIFLGIALVTR
jgi:drug/metabolite transporter (DMT)-like permease